MMTKKEFVVQAVLAYASSGMAGGAVSVVHNARALADEVDGRGYFEDEPKEPCPQCSCERP